MKLLTNRETLRKLRKRPRLCVKILLLFTVPLGVLYIILVINYMEKIKYENFETDEYENDVLPILELPDEIMFGGEKLIHIDLKGAPPNIDYLLKFIPFIKTLGATGILIEYEDMFPYHGELQNITALNAYTLSDIAALIHAAADNNLTVIPLLPTFSHLEFVLKLEQYKQFREVENDPQVICPSQKKVYVILKKMIDQILEAHPISEYLHIGCDNSESIGVCTKCQKLLREQKLSKNHIYFQHVKEIAEYLNLNYPAVQPIVWGNKFSKENEKIILFYKIPDLVEVMWNYKSDKNLFPRTDDMFMLSKLFRSLWIANTFKGAPGSQEIVTNIDRHLRNLRKWMEFAEEWRNLTFFKGIALLGSQRSNHFSVLSELLPVGIPSLAFNLQYLNLNSRNAFNFEEVKQSLNCSQAVPSNIYEIQDLSLVSGLKCSFPGFKVYHIIHIIYNALVSLMSSLANMQNADFTFYSILHNTSNLVYVHGLNLTVFKRKLLELDDLKNKTRLAMYEIYDEHTIGEWIMTHVTPVQMRLEAAINVLGAIRDLKIWPRRPFVTSEWKINNFFNTVCSKNDIMGCAIFNIR